MASTVMMHQALQPSLRLAAVLLLSHLAAAALLAVTAMPWPARLAILMLISLSLAYHMARDVLLLLDDSWCGIELDSGGVSIVASDGQR